MLKLFLGWLLTIGIFLVPVHASLGQSLFFGNNKPASAGSNTFTFIQQKFSACAANPCTVTVTSTGSGHLLVLTATEDSGSARYITSASGGGTWVVPAGCQSLNAASGATSCAYVLSSSSGTTSVSVTYTAGTALHVTFWEYLVSPGTASFGKTGVQNTTSGATPVPGVGLTGLGSSDVIFQWVILSASIGGPTAVSGSYIHLLNNAGSSTGLNYSGYASLENSGSGTAPNWTVPTSQQCTAAAITFR